MLMLRTEEREWERGRERGMGLTVRNRAVVSFFVMTVGGEGVGEAGQGRLEHALAYWVVKAL